VTQERPDDPLLERQPPDSPEAPEASRAGQHRLGRRLRRWETALALLLSVVFVATAWAYVNWFARDLGPAQPIPFSHRVHVRTKGISCLMCHEGAPWGYRATVPPLQTCMLCHTQVIVGYPWIRELWAHYQSGTPILWRRVNDVPDFVYFNHSVHIARKVDCGRCHGNVREMDRIVQAHKFEMGFCVQCHRDNKASHDCFTCHR
jgi:hypothetical protein